MVANLTTRLGQLTSSPAGGPYTGANKIINGDMAIDQRNAGASVVPAATAYTVDRFKLAMSQASKITIGQTYGGVTPPMGFTTYLGSKVTTTVTIGAGDFFHLQQIVEGLNCQDLNWGTANAKAVTLSFWVYSDQTGTFGGSLENSAVTRAYPFTYTVGVANTWTLITVNIAGDTSGTWLTSNLEGVRVNWGLGVGTTYSGTAGAWATADYRSATGAKNLMPTANALFYITGVKLEVGSIATPFVPDDYKISWDKCQRYYQSYSYNGYVSIGQITGAAQFISQYTYPNGGMRAATTITIPAHGSGAGQIYNFTATATDAGGTFVADQGSVNNCRIYNNGNAGVVAGNASLLISGANAVFSFDAEL